MHLTGNGNQSPLPVLCSCKISVTCYCAPLISSFPGCWKLLPESSNCMKMSHFTPLQKNVHQTSLVQTCMRCVQMLGSMLQSVKWVWPGSQDLLLHCMKLV